MEPPSPEGRARQRETQGRKVPLPGLSSSARLQPDVDGWGAISEQTNIFIGSLAALPTPFEHDRIAETPFADFVAWQIDEGSQSLVVCGPTGEAATLAPQERAQLIHIAVEAAAGRVPIIAATGTNCTRETIAATQSAQEAGASGAIVVTPYYNRPTQSGLYRHFFEIARSTDLPLIVENDPSRTGLAILPETLVQLAKIPNIVGVADMTGDLAWVLQTQPLLPQDFIRLAGDESVGVLFRMAGGRGSISTIANLVPKLWAEVQLANLGKHWERAASAQFALQPLLRALGTESSPGPVKYALSLLRPGFSPDMRLPLVAVSNRTRTAIETALIDLKLII